MALPRHGIVEAPEIVASPTGLFSVAKPETGRTRDGEQWIRGISQEWETTVQNLTNLDEANSVDYDLVSGAVTNDFDDVKSFFIEIEEDRSTMGFLGLDRMARIKRQLEAATQKAVERELWSGDIRLNTVPPQPQKSLVDGPTILDTTNAHAAGTALAILEQGIAEMSHTGEPGVIHITRDVASLLYADGRIRFSESGNNSLTTVYGTPVVIGSGYPGSGPIGHAHAAASVSNKWMFATGTVKVFLGDVDVVNDSLSQAYDVAGNQNDMRLKATRPAAVYFDTSIHLAVRVNLAA